MVPLWHIISGATNKQTNKCKQANPRPLHLEVAYHLFIENIEAKEDKLSQ